MLCVFENKYKQNKYLAVECFKLKLTKYEKFCRYSAVECTTLHLNYIKYARTLHVQILHSEFSFSYKEISYVTCLNCSKGFLFAEN